MALLSVDINVILIVIDILYPKHLFIYLFICHIFKILFVAEEWWHTPLIPAHWEDGDQCKFQASQGYIGRPCIKSNKRPSVLLYKIIKDLCLVGHVCNVSVQELGPKNWDMKNLVSEIQNKVWAHGSLSLL